MDPSSSLSCVTSCIPGECDHAYLRYQINVSDGFLVYVLPLPMT